MMPSPRNVTKPLFYKAHISNYIFLKYPQTISGFMGASKYCSPTMHRDSLLNLDRSLCCLNDKGQLKKKYYMVFKAGSYKVTQFLPGAPARDIYVPSSILPSYKSAMLKSSCGKTTWTQRYFRMDIPQSYSCLRSASPNARQRNKELLVFILTLASV